MNPTASFIHILDREINCSTRLLKVLRRENAALKNADTDTLETIVTEKETLLVELDSRVSAHNAFLDEQGLPPGLEGTEKLLDYFANDPRAEKKWSELQELAQACRNLNEINGGIVALSQRHVRKALDILSGNNGPAGNTYGRCGETHSMSSSQSIGKA